MTVIKCRKASPFFLLPQNYDHFNKFRTNPGNSRDGRPFVARFFEEFHSSISPTAINLGACSSGSQGIGERASMILFVVFAKGTHQNS